MSQWHFDQLKYALGFGGLFTFYGIVTIIVWFLGEKMKLQVESTIVIIALVLLTLPFVLIIGFVVSRRAKKKEAAEQAQQEAAAAASAEAAAPAKLSAPKGNYDEISQTAEETVNFLKGSNLGGGKDAVYELPWYLVVGTPKSGKTSLALASGLNFQTLPSQRESEQKIIRPTKNIDWRVASDAVFIDTAGRYLTEGGDEDEWAGILETLKKYRGQRPLDGMILGISAERILHSDEADIEQMAKILRTRIDEVLQRLKVRFPVYLIFTHADSIEGFRDSFSSSQKEGENLVWGATIPLEKSENAHTLFDGEFDLLQNSIMKRRLIRLSAPFPPVRQLKIFNFPLHFNSARKKLGHFVATLFRPNPFSESPLLRGFYFTAVPVNRPKANFGQTMTNLAQTVGQSFFTEKLFRDVILRDKDLVSTFQSQQVRAPIFGWLLTFFGAIIIFILLALTGVSLYQNKKEVDLAAQRGEDVLLMYKSDKDRNPLAKDAEQTRTEIDKIENLRKSLVILDEYERNRPPLWMRFGLYSGNRIYRDYLLNIYYNAIEQRFKKPVVKKLEDELKKFSESQPINSVQLTTEQENDLGKKYDLLKAYLMLSGQYKDRAEATFLADTLKDFWKTESKTPEGRELVAQQQLEFYAKQVDRLPRFEGDKAAFPRINLDDNNTKGLIESVRKRLQAFPTWARYYKRVTTDISKKVEPVSADSILAGRSANVIESTTSVPGAYTIDGYRKYMKEAFTKATEELTKDDWVMGESADKAQAKGDDFRKIQDKYFNDYADQWRKFVQNVRIIDFKKSSDAVVALKAFSNSESPMKILLQDIAKHTHLSKEPEQKGIIAWIWSFFKSDKQDENATVTEVEKQFNSLFVFTDESKKDGQSPISLYGADLGKLGDELETKSNDEIKAISQEMASGKGKFASLMNSVEKGINAKTEGFQTTAAGKDIAILLKKPINNLKMFFGEGERSQIQKAWESEILPKAKDAEKGFPFNNEGEADFTKLTLYLKPKDGILSKFYDEKLKKFFEEADGQIKVKEDSPIKFTDEFVKYLNNAFKLRQAFFQEGTTASFKYNVTMEKLPDANIVLTIDGQKLESSGTGSGSFTFPGAAGDKGVLMDFASTAETTSTSGSTSPSPSPSGSPASSPAPTSKFTQPTPASSPSSSGNQIREPGDWGLFKFFDRGSPKKDADGKYICIYNINGKKVTVNFKPIGGDLFDRKIFQDSKAPQTIFK